MENSFCCCKYIFVDEVQYQETELPSTTKIRELRDGWYSRDDISILQEN